MSTVERLFPLPEPRPHPGCPACVDLARRRHAARERCDLSRVTDLNVLLRRHHREAHATRDLSGR